MTPVTQKREIAPGLPHPNFLVPTSWRQKTKRIEKVALRMAPRKSICLKLGVSATSVMFFVEGQAKKRIMIAAEPMGTLHKLAGGHWHQNSVLRDLLDPIYPSPCRSTGYYTT